MLTEERIREICIEKLPVLKSYMGSPPKRLWIYGAGVGGLIICDVLQENGFNVQGFIDRRAEELLQISGLPVVSMDAVNPKEDFIVISLRDVEWPAIDVCKKHGFSMTDIYYLAAGEDFNKEDIIYKGCRVGRYTYGYEYLLKDHPIAESIGRFCSINDTARIWNNHPIDYVSTHPFLDHPMFYPWEKQVQREQAMMRYGKYFDNVEFEKSPFRKNMPVVIENDVWIGANAVILPGVHIANGAVIAAGSVVTHNVGAYEIVGGIPARVIRHRYSPQQIEQFQAIQWWNWEIEEIEDNYDLFCQPEKFLNKFSVLHICNKT